MPESKLELVIPGITDSSTLACISRARTFTQYRRMVEDNIAGRCPFCNVDREYNKVVAETEHWFAWPCNPPEKNTKHHLLYVPKRHIVSIRALFANEILDLFLIRDEVVIKNGWYTSCGLLIRDGDATLSAGTVQHLHVHEMVPDGTGRVESPFYKGREAEEASLRRALIFEKMRVQSEKTGQTDPFLLCDVLSEEEVLLVADRLR